jgi:hypothetical protein
MAGESVFNPSMVKPPTRRSLEDLGRRLLALEAALGVTITGGSTLDRAYTDQQDANHSLEDKQYAETLLDNRMYGPTGLDLAALVAAANALVGTDIGAIENPDMFASDLIVARHLLAGSVTGESIRATGSITTGGTGSRIQIIGSDNPATTSIRSIAGPPIQLNLPHGDWNGTGVPTPIARLKYTNGILLTGAETMEVVGVATLGVADTVGAVGWIPFDGVVGAYTLGVNDLDGLAPNVGTFTTVSGHDIILHDGVPETIIFGTQAVVFGGNIVTDGDLI